MFKHALVLGLALFSGCTTTHVLDSWKAEGAQPLKRATKRVVVVSAQNVERRDRAEKKLAEEMNATSLRSLFTSEELANRDDVKAKLLEQGFAELVVMRVTGVEEEQTRIRGPVWANWMVLSTPYVSNTRVDLITSVYDIAEGALVWQVASHTYDPASVEALLEEQVKVGVERLKADGMLVD